MTAQTQKPAAAPKPPGPIARKTSELAGHVIHSAWPYLAACAGAVVVAAASGEGWPLLLVLGAAGWHAVLRLHEAFGWHRRGGRAAARARRKYQGPATWRERRAKLSAQAIRNRAHVVRPATGQPHKLPAEELGVLIGYTVRGPGR